LGATGSARLGRWCRPAWDRRTTARARRRCRAAGIENKFWSGRPARSALPRPCRPPESPLASSRRRTGFARHPPLKSGTASHLMWRLARAWFAVFSPRLFSAPSSVAWLFSSQQHGFRTFLFWRRASRQSSAQNFQRQRLELVVVAGVEQDRTIRD